MNILRRLLGLGPKKPVNTVTKSQQEHAQKEVKEKVEFDSKNILPVLVSEKTKEFDLNNELVEVFHSRDNNYAQILISFMYFEHITEEEINAYQLGTADKDEDFFYMLQEKGDENLDNFNLPFVYWNPIDEKLPYKVLSTTTSCFAPSKILSKKHMLQAHEMLNTDELFVSIPRNHVIYVCDRNLSEEDYSSFLRLHAYTVLTDMEGSEVLCEDLFVVKNGEIEQVLSIQQLSDSLLGGEGLSKNK